LVRVGVKNKQDKLHVIILGAGVSASCGIPVAKDILRESMIALARVDAESAREVHRLLSYLYPDFVKKYRNYPNIENFLNLIEMAHEFNSEGFIESSLWPRPRIKAMKEIVLDAVTNYVWGFFDGAQPPPSSSHLDIFFNRHVPAGTVIITFNWDLTVERALAQGHATPITYQYSTYHSEDRLTLLKPHDSIDWFDVNAIRKAGVAGTKSLDSKVRVVDFGNLLLSRDLIKASPIIVPPVSNKEFSTFSVFQKTWASVFRAISSATALTILGYSLPREDQFSRFVFRRALRNNIRRAQAGKKRRLEVTVINPDESTESTFASLVGRDKTKFKFHRTYFQDFVDSL